MPETCSCGTQLVEDALFCHRCGKAQRELLSVAPEDQPAVQLVPPPPAVVAPPPIGFSNSVAVRLCFLVASVASVLDAMPVVMLFGVIWSFIGGFAAVALYRRATGLALNTREGAKIGWITGVLNSLILTVLLTVSVAASSAEVHATWREQMRAAGTKDPAVLAMLDNPYVLATCLLLLLLLLFAFVSMACVAGGALGARILRDDRAPGHQPR